MNIPEKGWFLYKEETEKPGAPPMEGVKVFYNGEQMAGIQRISVEFDVENFTPILELRIIPFKGLGLSAYFGQLGKEVSTEPTIFHSTKDPIELLKELKEAKPEIP